MIQLYNSLTRQKETFVPLEENHIKMYVCGMTVYDYCHIGHARSLVAFDMINRYFRHKGYQVKFVRNITDIDDKIIARAQERGITIQDLTSEFIDKMHEDCEALNILSPDSEPRATAHVEGMITMISKLMDKGLAYRADNGDVYYRVRAFKEYGKLSNQSIDELRAGERVAVDQFKEDPVDFVLWKHAKEGEPAWDSPFGPGRPGWHIECSVMSEEELGIHFDIHGGGMDLKFPHHECEIAQSEGCHDEKMANYWMHNGFINIDNEKMSKSLGNFFTIREILEVYPAEVLRFFILSTHYRSHINYSNETITQAGNGLRRLYTALSHAPEEVPMLPESHPLLDKFYAAMDDDFNSALAISILYEAATAYNKTQDAIYYTILKELGAVLGLLQQDPKQFLQGDTENLTIDIDAMIAARNQARAEKNWAESDRIRDELAALGIALEDKNGQTTWRKIS
ncbi:cysteine--tRNA ligase [Ignatzschineria larvae DSM 13226]|uniref:Cysteine--tRNA ligase n=1 Tax=Ignatzschineria larvae DSM 13226 TaxID=1111732 RepID=A0ABZ3C134_9GAMM|nr:cysteine--tRNA ligase [Ignatzschineria larvae]